MATYHLATTLSRLCCPSSRLSISARRAITVPTPALGTQFDVRIFVDPIVDRKKVCSVFISINLNTCCIQLDEPLDPVDDRNFLYPKPMKFDQTPVFYRDYVVDKLVRVCLLKGRKETSRKNILEALEIIKRRQYARLKAQKADDTEKIEMDPFVIANTAIRNCAPLMKLLNVTRGTSNLLLDSSYKKSIICRRYHLSSAVSNPRA